MADGTAQPKLTLKQEAFIAAYLGAARGNATEAARIAGYRQPQSQGSRLLKNVDIAARVSGYVAARYADADMVLEKLSEIAFAPSFEFIEVVARDKSGKPIKVKMDLSNQVKSLELLGKHHQLFTDKIDISGDLGVTYELVGMDPSELA
jgi:phage terminase small subunit